MLRLRIVWVRLRKLLLIGCVFVRVRRRRNRLCRFTSVCGRRVFGFIRNVSVVVLVPLVALVRCRLRLIGVLLMIRRLVRVGSRIVRLRFVCRTVLCGLRRFT